MRGARVLTSSARTGTGRDDWCTPSVVLDRVRAVGSIALDPCAPLRANPVRARRTYTVRDDGLARPWRGLTYVNPPYSELRPWATKIVDEAKRGVPIIALVPARTDTRAWSRLMEPRPLVALWRGRITFVGASSGAPFPSAVLGFNVDADRFLAAFATKAIVMTSYARR